MTKLKQFALLFLIPWAILFAASLFTTPDGLPPAERLAVTGILACAIPLLYRVANRGEKNKALYSVCRPGTMEPVVRVEGEWIYRGAEEGAAWYRKKDSIYGFQSMKPICRVEDDKVYRAGEEEPFLIREGNALLSPQGDVVYEIH